MTGAARPRVISAWRGEEFQRDSVGIAEADTGAVRGVFDVTVIHSELVEAPGPRLELAAIGATEGDVVKPDLELAEPSTTGWRTVLMQTDERAFAGTNTVWCISGSVSSSSTGSASNRAWYHGTLTARSLTVKATWVSGGNAVMFSPGLLGMRARGGSRRGSLAESLSVTGCADQYRGVVVARP